MRHELTCGICGGTVVVLHTDQHGSFPAHEGGDDHAPDVECLGSVTEAADFLGIEMAELFVQQDLVALRPQNKPAAPWVIFRG